MERWTSAAYLRPEGSGLYPNNGVTAAASYRETSPVASTSLIREKSLLRAFLMGAEIAQQTYDPACDGLRNRLREIRRRSTASLTAAATPAESRPRILDPTRAGETSRESHET